MGKDLDYGYKGDQIHDEDMEDSQVSYVVGDSNIFTKGMSSDVYQTKETGKFERFFRSVYISIERRPADPNVEKGELIYIADNIFKEASKGASADPSALHRWLKQMYALAPDVFQVCITILTTPSSGLPSEIVDLAHRTQEEFQPAGQMTLPLNSYLEQEIVIQGLSQEDSDKMRSQLSNLQLAVNDGNVRPVRELVDGIIGELPGMRQPIRHWLVESTEVPTTIQVFARKYLS